MALNYKNATIQKKWALRGGFLQKCRYKKYRIILQICIA